MFAVIRIRGSAGMKREMKDALKMLRLNAAYNCVIVPETTDYKGMAEKVKDAVTWGEITRETLAAMLKKRLKLEENRKIDEKNLKSVTGYDSFEAFADALLQGKVKLKSFNQLQTVFKLTPPSKGFKSVKEHYPNGDLGYRGKEINELIERMI